MSLTRRIALSLLLVAIIVVSVVLGDAWLWLTIILAAVFFVGLFWPSKKSSG